MEKGQFVAVRRDTSAKLILKIDTAVNSVTELLDDIHDSMYRKYAVTLKCLFAIFGVLTLTLETKKEKTHTHPCNSPFSGTTQVSRYQKGKTNLDFAEARDSEWQWHELGHMQVCISLQTDNRASTSPLKVFYRPDALPAAQPTASKH